MDEIIEDGKRPAHWRRPFEVTRDDEERVKDKGKIISVRLNEEELELAMKQKELLDTDVLGSAIKFFWKAGWNVTHRTLGEENIAWIASRDRVRSLKKSHKNIRNVIQDNGGSVGHPDK